MIEKKIIMLTAYDYQMARILGGQDVDYLLVGDSVGMVVYGESDTRSVGLETMIKHGRAVVKGVEVSEKTKVVVDVPFLASDELIVENSKRILEETGAFAVKIEGRAEQVRLVVQSGVKVFGHTGLKPQTAERFVVQGRGDIEGEEVLKEALALEAAGVVGVVLECVPEKLGKQIADALSVPVIGIGAGRFCDGQVLVTQDLLGMTPGKLPKFVRKYSDLAGAISESVANFCEDVSRGDFPGDAEIYN